MDINEEIKWQKEHKALLFFRKIARFCYRFRCLKRIAMFIWKRQKMACDYCGRLVGMDSTISQYGFTCGKCLDGLEKDPMKR